MSYVSLRGRMIRGTAYSLSAIVVSKLAFAVNSVVVSRMLGSENLGVLVILWNVMALAGILLVPSLSTLWTAWQKFLLPTPPAPIPLTLVGLGSLVVNVSCALILMRFRAHSGSLTRAAFLSARNDAVANVAIIDAGFITAATKSGWPDLIVGLGILTINADAARKVWRAAREEHAVS